MQKQRYRRAQASHRRVAGARKRVANNGFARGGGYSKEIAAARKIHEIAEKQTETMSESPFRPYERLVNITVMGRTFQVPEKNSVLRCFQYLSPETIPYGRFCWNQDCQYCRVLCQLPDDDQPREMLACKFLVMPGMNITQLSPELKWCLRAKLKD